MWSRRLGQTLVQGKDVGAWVRLLWVSWGCEQVGMEGEACGRPARRMRKQWLV